MRKLVDKYNRWIAAAVGVVGTALIVHAVTQKLIVAAPEIAIGGILVFLALAWIFVVSHGDFS